MRKKPEIVVTGYLDVLMKIKMHVKRITITGDIIFVNRIPFFVTFGRDLVSYSGIHTNQNSNTTRGSLMNVVKVYAKSGCKIKMMIMDLKFDIIKTILLKLSIIKSAAQENIAKWNGT